MLGFEYEHVHAQAHAKQQKSCTWYDDGGGLLQLRGVDVADGHDPPAATRSPLYYPQGWVDVPATLQNPVL